MDNYVKDCVNEIDDKSLPFERFCDSNVIQMKVKSGTKIKNIIEYSVKHFVANENERKIVIMGSSLSSNKAISCAEILKRKSKTDLFQMTNICYKSVEEIWKPKDTHLDVLKVIRKIPQIYILLSKDPLDLNEPGVQYKDSFQEFNQFSNNDIIRNKRSKYSKHKYSPKNSTKSNQSNETMSQNN